MTLSRPRISRYLAVMASAILATSFLLVPAGSASAAVTTTPALTSDLTPPTLISVGLTGSPVLRGGSATLSYAVESRDPLSSVTFTYRDPTGSPVNFETTTGDLAGTLPVAFPPTAPLGDYYLMWVTLKDSAGDTMTYYNDGSTFQSATRVTGRHTVAFTPLHVLLVSQPTAPVVVSAQARSGGAIVSWYPTDTQSTPVSGYTITAQPGGKTFTSSGTASSSASSMYAEMTGLANGTTYTFTVSAANLFGAGPASSRTAAVTPMMSTNVFAMGDVSGDGRNDLVAVRPAPEPWKTSPLFLYRGNGIGGFGGMTRLADLSFRSEGLRLFSAGDFSGDKMADRMIIQDGKLYTENGDGHGGFSASNLVGNGWGSMRFAFGPGDFSGDGKADVLAVTSTGDLNLYRGNGRGGWASAIGQKLGSGWGSFLTVFSRGDFSGDGESDILGVSKDGGLYLYPGNGRGGFAAAGQRIGNGWGSFISVISAGGDFSGDHKTDLLAVDNAGNLILYRGNGRGGFAAAGQAIGTGWAGFR